MSRTSASYGQWGGYNTERGLAWIMDTGSVAGCARWYARFGDKSYGPASSADAKAAARAFVTGAALEKDELAFAGAVDLNAAAVKALESQAPTATVIGRRILYDLRDLEAWLATRKQRDVAGPKEPAAKMPAQRT